MDEEITLNGITYIRSDKEKGSSSQGSLQYVVVRSPFSGCHAGYLKAQNGDRVTLVNSRRLWYWDGACTLSQLAMEGVKRPENCKFPCKVREIKVFGVCEIIQTTEVARASIERVPIWEQK